MKPRQSVQAIVFDCFGVLYEDAFKQFTGRYVTASAPHPREYYYDLALQADRGHIGDADFYAELATLSGLAPSTIQRHFRQLTVLNEDLVALIEQLKPHYRIGMLSNAERTFLDRFLDNHNLIGHFDATLASSETSFVKPQEPIFSEMARRLDVTYDEMLFIDDSPVNTAAARRYGITSVTYEDPARLRLELNNLLDLTI
jgi:HAD superfamily hydrolase (TIGR01509 family)